jgi:hypothetical protein
MRKCSRIASASGVMWHFRTHFPPSLRTTSGRIALPSVETMINSSADVGIEWVRKTNDSLTVYEPFGLSRMENT